MNEITKYIPHREKMILIDKIVNFERENFCVEVTISEGSLLATSKGVPSYTGLEYMAQSIAAFNTLHFEKIDSSAPKLGFIVSVRNYKSYVDYFKLGSVLHINVDPLLIVKNSGSFSSNIKCDGEIISVARITAYVPSVSELKDLKKEANNE